MDSRVTESLQRRGDALGLHAHRLVLNQQPARTTVSRVHSLSELVLFSCREEDLSTGHLRITVILWRSGYKLRELRAEPSGHLACSYRLLR